jgi:hypothetical protein
MRLQIVRRNFIFSKTRTFSIREFLDSTQRAARLRNCRFVRTSVGGRAATARARAQDRQKIYGYSAGARTACKMISRYRVFTFWACKIDVGRCV